MPMVNRAEVQKAIVNRTRAINDIVSDPRLIRELGARGMLCFFSFLQNSNGEDLTNAIKDIETAINLIKEQSDPDPGLATLCYCCGCAMQIKFLFTSNDLTDLEDAIRYFRRALDLNGPDSDSGPDKFPNACRYHSDLAAALHTRFKRLGHVKDIDDAITHFSTALNLTHTSNPTIVPTINSDLGAAYQSRFERLGEHEDLDKAIEVLRLSVERQSNEDNTLPGRLNNLGLSLQHKFELAGDGSVLNEGIACFRQAVKLTSMSRHEWLSSLGTAYRIAAENATIGAEGYIASAMDYLQRAVDLARSDSHKNLPKYLAKLAMCFGARARLTSCYGSDTDKSITLLQAALVATPEYHDAERSALLLCYGDALQNRYDHSPESIRDEEDVSKAMEQFQACSKLRYGPLMAQL